MDGKKERENKNMFFSILLNQIKCCGVTCFNMFSSPLPFFNNHVLNISNILVPSMTSMWRPDAILFQGSSDLKTCDFQDMFFVIGFI